MPGKVRALLLAPLGLLALVASGCGGRSDDDEALPCQYAGHSYARGDTFPAQDGCNTCSCESDGNVACTLLGCDSCEDVSSRYADALEDAKACDPSELDQCSKLVVEGLACGCQAFVNASNSQAIAAAELAQQQYATLSCGEGIACGPCLAPDSASCSTAGRCEPVYDDQAGAELP